MKINSVFSWKKKVLVLLCLSFFGCGFIKDVLQPYLVAYSSLPDIPLESSWNDLVEKDNDSLKILCVGTSLTFGADGQHPGRVVKTPWPMGLEGELIRDSIWPVQIKNVGVSGAVLREINLFAMDAIKSYPADLVFVDVGANEVLENFSLTQFQKGLLQFADSIQNTGARLVFLGSPPLLGPKNRAIIEFVRVTREVASQKGAAFLNLNRKFGKYMEKNDLDYELLPDGVHLTQAGYTLWAEFVFDYLHESEQKERRGFPTFSI